MSKIRVVFKNISWLTISQVINSVCAFFWTIVIANYLGVEKYGIISFATSFIGIAIIFIDFGMTTYVTREVARDKKRLEEYVGLVIPVKIILSISVFFLSTLILFFCGCTKTTILITMIYLFEMVLISFTQFINGIFQAYEDLKYQAIGCLINCTLLIIFVLLVILLNLGIFAIAISYVIGYSGFFCFMAVKYLQKFELPKLQMNFRKALRTIKNALPFGLTTLFNTIYFGVNTVMLSGMKGDYETGIYKAVMNVILVFTTLFSVYQLVLFPVMSRFFVNQKELIWKSYEKSVKYLLAVALPMCAGIFIYAKQVILLIYNHSYTDAILPLKISIWTVVMLFLNGVTMLVLNAIDMEKRVTTIYLIGAGVNALLNYWLIPRYSYNGSAIATLISVSLIFLILLIQILNTEFGPKSDFMIHGIKLITAAGVMFIILWGLKLPLWAGIIVGAFVYGGMVITLRVIDDTDRYILKHMIHKEK